MNPHKNIKLHYSMHLKVFGKNAMSLATAKPNISLRSWWRDKTEHKRESNYHTWIHQVARNTIMNEY